MTEEAFEQNCPYCGKPVTIRWNEGVVSSKEYVLIADWVYHSTCWDKQIEEHPP
jgi:hypothetical protein